MAPKEDIMDMSKLSQRELLLLLHVKVERVESKVETLSGKQEDLKMDVERIKAKSSAIASAWGIAAIIISAIISTIKIFK